MRRRRSRSGSTFAATIAAWYARERSFCLLSVVVFAVAIVVVAAIARASDEEPALEG